jgi:hypothetical protein
MLELVFTLREASMPFIYVSTLRPLKAPDDDFMVPCGANANNNASATNTSLAYTSSNTIFVTGLTGFSLTLYTRRSVQKCASAA